MNIKRKDKPWKESAYFVFRNWIYMTEQKPKR